MSRTRLVTIVVASLAVLVLVTLLTTRNATRDAPLDPDNPDPGGAQATARVLAEQGVDVEVVRDQAALLDARLAGASVVVAETGSLGRSTARTLRRTVAEAGADLLVLGTNPRTGGLDAGQGVVSGRVSAGCEDPAYADLVVAVTPTAPLPEPGQGGGGGVTCFESFTGPLLVRQGTTTRVATASVLRNDQVLRADNAAFALRLLGARDRLVWYVPSPADTRPTDGVALTTLLPPWTSGVLVLGVVAFGAFLLVRGRRLGPLVTEPVPVPVRSAESTVSRGRMYAASRDRSHAAAALRTGTRVRLAATTGLDTHTDLDSLLGRLGEQGQDVARARSLLADAPVGDDRQLVELAGDLTRLEDEVARA